VAIGPHEHDETLELPAGVPGPWGWPCPRCETENVVRERPTWTGTAVEVGCDYCGAVTHFEF
jgi:hypothetical protein